MRAMVGGLPMVLRARGHGRGRPMMRSRSAEAVELSKGAATRPSQPGGREGKRSTPAVYKPNLVEMEGGETF